jgi:hypothetical protein
MKVPNKYKARIWAMDDERSSGNGIFIHYRRYWRSARDYGLHIDTVDGVREMQNCIKDAVPCDCTDCQSGRGWTPGVNC